jgi:hypothetical protein
LSSVNPGGNKSCTKEDEGSGGGQVTASLIWHCGMLYRVIQNSLRDFRPLQYSNRDGHAERQHVNGGRDTPSFCPSVQVLDMSTLGDAADVKFGNFGKFQDTERFLIPWPRHVSSRLPPSGETCKYAMVPKKKNLERFSPY